jgi:archaemetzincin
LTSKNKSVAVLPLGDIPEIDLQVIADQIIGRFKLTTQVLPPFKPPDHAFDKRRLQYNAGIIIEAMEAMQFGNHNKVIGVLNKDLFIPIFTHVFGEARQGGTCGLISLYRLAKNPDGSTPERSHCEHKQCLMHFSGGIDEVDEMSLDLCEYCSIYLQDKLR